MTKKEKIINSILVSFAFVFNLFIFGTTEFYYTNIFDFWFPIRFVLPIVITIAIVFFCFLFLLLYKVKDKIRIKISVVIISLTVALYIQGNFLNVGYGQLDGSEVNWSSMVFKGVINTIVWIIIFLVFFLFAAIKKNLYNLTSNFVSLFIVGIEVITLIVVVNSYVFNDSFNDITTRINYTDKAYYLNKKDLFNMSKDENIVFFMVDSLETNFFNDLIKEYPEFKKTFSNFTYYDNVTSCSLLTFMSMPTLLTGETLKVGETLQENINNGFEKTEVFDTLEKNGYKSELYVDLSLIPTNEEKNKIANLENKELEVKLSSKVGLSGNLIKCVLYKYMPHFLKPMFYVDTKVFSKVSSNGVEPYFEDDLQFYNDLVENKISTNADSKRYKVIEMGGAHSPFYINKDIKSDKSDEYQQKSQSEKQENQIYAVFKILEEYINELKEKGVYDNTTIIITADHGFNNRYNPVLLIKKNNDKNEEMKINHAPISQIEDFVPTILNIATKTKDYGKDIYDYEENAERTRIINNYYFSRDKLNQVYVESNIQMGIDGLANNKDNYYIANQEFSTMNEIKQEYKIGSKLSFNNIYNEYMTTKGIILRTGDVTSKGSTIGNSCEITIKPEKTESDIFAELDINDVYNKKQRIIIKTKDQVLVEKEIAENDSIYSVEFKIPNELWNQDEEFKLEIELPDATNYSSNETKERLGTDWVQRAFIFNYLIFDNEF